MSFNLINKGGVYMRVTINLNDDLVSLIDEEAKRLNISRSAFICVCCSSDMNAYYRQFNVDSAIDTFVERVKKQESIAQLIGKSIDDKKT